MRRALLAYVAAASLTLVVAAAALAGNPTVAPQPSASSTGTCNTAVDTGPVLRPRTQFVSVGSYPFGVTAVPGYAFVATPQRLEVLSDSGSTPAVVHSILLPGSAAGTALSRDGRYLLVSDGGSGAFVVDVAAAEHGASGALLGELTQRRLSTGIPGGSIEVAVTNDDRYAFVALEDTSRIAVYRLAAGIAGHFKGSYYVGSIPTAELPVGLMISPDGRWLYSTSEMARGGGGKGTLSVINVAKAEREPAHSVVSTVQAGCGPVRVVTSADGAIVWVTARESDDLLAFSAAKLRSQPAAARLATVLVGEAPVGLALINGGSQIVVADSNRFNAPGRSSGLTVVDTAAALAGRPAVIGTIAAQLFPREMALEPGGADLLVGNFGSKTLEVVPTADLGGSSG
jgi:DNA-binding beta-propeller fold protein YncE